MNVRELIEHLKTFDQALEVWYCADLCDFAVYRITPDEVRNYELEDDFGDNFPCLMIGDMP